MKILILTTQPYTKIGGIEKYTKNLVDILKNNNIKSYIFLSEKEEKEEIENIENYFRFKWKNKKSKFWLIKIINYILHGFSFKSQVNKIIKANKIDFIISNFNFSLPKKLYKKTIYIQHCDESILFKKKMWQKIVDNIFNLHLISKKSYFFVTYTEKLKDFLMKKYKLKSTVFVCPLFSSKITKSNNLQLVQKKNKYIFVSRIDKDKNINFLIEMSKFLSKEIDIYGDGLLIDKIKNIKNVNYMGKLKQDDSIKTIEKYQCLISVSDAEGFGFVFCESMSCGVPIAIRNTFYNASYFYNDGKNGVLIDKNKSPKEMAEILNKTDWSKFNRDEIINFSCKNLSWENFLENWNYIIKEVMLNKKD